MFFKSYWKQYNHQFERAEKLEQRVRELEQTIDDHNKGVTTKARDDVASSTFSLNFDTMNVFSIERLVGSDHYRAQTVIGYFREDSSISDGVLVTNKHVHEWTLNCSQAEHERLVAEFNVWKAKKK